MTVYMENEPKKPIIVKDDKLAEALKDICDVWCKKNQKSYDAPLAFVKLRMVGFRISKFHTATEVGNFKKAFEELDTMYTIFNSFNHRLSRASDETKELLEMTIGELLNPSLDSSSNFSFSDLEKFSVDIKNSITEALAIVNSLSEKSTKANYVPLRVCRLAASLAPLAGFEDMLPKNINKENGFGLFLGAIFFTVDKYEKIGNYNIVNAWRSYNQHWYS